MYPSQSADKFVVRLPDGLRDRIKMSAAANHRSMNAEIVHHLDAAVTKENGPAGTAIPPSQNHDQSPEKERAND